MSMHAGFQEGASWPQQFRLAGLVGMSILQEHSATRGRSR